MTPRRKRARKYISLREKLAAALSMLLPQEQRDALRARKAPAKAVIACFDFDHVVLHALLGPDRWHNLTPLLRTIHRQEKSPRDTSIVAKTRRLSAKQEEFNRKVVARPCGQKRQPKKGIRSIPGRRFNGDPIQARWR